MRKCGHGSHSYQNYSRLGKQQFSSKTRVSDYGVLLGRQNNRCVFLGTMEMKLKRFGPVDVRHGNNFLWSVNVGRCWGPCD